MWALAMFNHRRKNLDGTARGGIVIAIKDKLDIPVKFVGLGEKPEDIAEFDPNAFVEALFEPSR